MKTRLARFAFGLILAPLMPIACLLLFWWAAFTVLPEKWIPAGALLGLLLGILVDVFVLKWLVEHAYQSGLIFWLVILLFYSVGTFGFFMGVPIFNVALAIPAGFVVGARLAHSAAEQVQVQHSSRQACYLTTVLMTLVCAASAFFALMSPSTPADLRGMLGLGFEVTPSMLWGLILVGGAGLLVVNWLLTGLAIRITYRYLSIP